MKTVQKTQLIAVIREASDTFKSAARRTKILPSLAWSADVAREFFRKKEAALPSPSYAIDKKVLADAIEGLKALTPKLKGEHPVLRWLHQTQESFIQGIRLLMEVETDAFYEIGTTLYGNSTTKPFEGTTTNLELARAIAGRLSASSVNDVAESNLSLSAEQFSAGLEAMLKQRNPLMPVRVEISDALVSKIAAGMSRVRIRKDARFSELELRALWNHEIDSHCLTAHNGAAQEGAEFLCAGGPRTTMTQEGLAVFYEVYGHTMSQQRFISLCNRIEAVSLVENGATFIDLYRWYKERSESDMEAFYNTQRIFRGAKLTGRAPFTKDVVYLSGLLGVYNYLRIAVKHQNRLLVETLVCGRIALEDVGTIAWLRTHGIVSPPRFAPDWLKNWEALLSFFSFFAFLNTVDMTTYQNYFQNHHSLQEWDFSL